MFLAPLANEFPLRSGTGRRNPPASLHDLGPAQGAPSIWQLLQESPPIGILWLSSRSSLAHGYWGMRSPGQFDRSSIEGTVLPINLGCTVVYTRRKRVLWMAKYSSERSTPP